MQTQLNHRNPETIDANQRPHKLPSCLQLAEIRMRRRPVRISFPLARREACMTKRSMLAVMREAEFHDWLANGGDLLDPMHQPVA